MLDIYEILDELGIAYEKYEHPAVYTCEEADRLCPQFEGPSCKNLFLRDRKGRNHFLVMIDSSKKVDLKNLSELMGSRLSFASPERLERILGLTPGAVTPFGLINEAAGDVIVIIDKELLQAEKLHFHPNINTATLELSTQDFEKFLESRGNELKILDFA